MKSFNKLNTGLLVVLTATVATVAQPQPASAQLLDIAAGALNALVRSKQPQPQVIQQRVPVPVPTPTGPEYNVGTNNANGNSLNLCLSGCLPNGAAPAPQPMPQVIQQAPIMPQTIPQVPIVQQPTSGTVVQQSSGGINTATNQINQQSSSQSAVVQNVPNPAAVNMPR